MGSNWPASDWSSHQAVTAWSFACLYSSSWWTFRLWVIRVFVLHICTTRMNFAGLVSRRRLGDFDLWPFLPWNWCAILPVGWATFLPILVFLGHDVSFSTYRPTPVRRVSSHVTLRPWPLTLEVRVLVVFVLRLCIKLEVRIRVFVRKIFTV